MLRENVKRKAVDIEVNVAAGLTMDAREGDGDLELNEVEMRTWS